MYAISVLDFALRPEVRTETPQRFGHSALKVNGCDSNKAGMSFRFKVIELVAARPIKDSGKRNAVLFLAKTKRPSY